MEDTDVDGNPQTTEDSGSSDWIWPAIGAVASGGLALAGNSVNSSNQKSINEANIRNQWATTYYDNFYNSPAEQRKRLEQAGLNPALMYGKMGTGESSTQLARQEAPHFDTSGIPQALNGYAALRSTQLQADNMRKQQAVMDSQIALNTGQLSKTAADTAKTTTETQLARSTMQSAIDFAALNVSHERLKQDQTLASTDSTRATADATRSAQANQTAITAATLTNMDLDAARKRIDNAWAPAKAKQEVRLLVMQYHKMRSELIRNFGTMQNDVKDAKMKDLERIEKDIDIKLKQFELANPWRKTGIPSAVKGKGATPIWQGKK